MRKRQYLTLCMIGALAVGAAACDQNITSLNQNPNSPEDVPAGPLFTYATRTSVSRWLGSGYDLRGTEFVIQHFGEAQYPDEDRYTRLTGSSTSGYFTGPYTAELEDYRKIIAKGDAAGETGTSAPARIMQTWGYSYLTDTFGDIPYSQALMGDSADAPIHPAYDAQKDIYASFFATLTQASQALSGAKNTLGAADPLFGGDPAGWQKFANSLHARLALRVVNVDPGLADAELKAAFSAPGGIIETNADNVMLQWPGDGVYNNPWADNFETRDDHRMSNTFMDVLNGTNDPRTPIFAAPTDDGEYAGMPNGVTNSTDYMTTASRPGLIFMPAASSVPGISGPGASTPSYVMTAAEVLFIEAEAAERSLGGLTPAQAKGFYDAAIQASMAQWGVSSADANAFLAQPEVAYKGGTDGLKQIALQRWVALYTDGGQAWALWRRTCVPSTIRPGPAAIADAVPRRFQYAPSEYLSNEEAVTAAVDRQGPDEFETHVWWDNLSASPTAVTDCGVR